MTDDAPPPPAPAPPRRHGLIGSFRFAFAGISYLFRTQRNARIHGAVAIIVCLLAAWLRVTRVEWAILVLTIACVLILEGLNTALEAVVDLASPQVHPLAKIAKDVTAGMVLVAAVAAVIVGLLILGPPLWACIAPP
jgi:diacylglycerol kinase